MTTWADPDSVAEKAEEWSDRTLACRTYGHGWASGSVVRAGEGFVVMQRCPRCENRRTQEMDSRGYATPWRYLYADGYLTKGLGRIDNHGRAVLRIANLRHLTVLDPEQ